MKPDMDNATRERRLKATARFMLRVIAAERAHGIERPDAAAFKARMVRIVGRSNEDNARREEDRHGH